MMMQTKPILSVKNLSLFKKEESDLNSALVKDLSFNLAYAKTTALIGESGSGKSLTALAIMRLLPNALNIASNTQILLQVQDQTIDLAKISELKMQTVRGKEIAIVFQDPMTALNPVMNIQDQIQEAMGSKNNKQEVLRLLNMVKLKDPEGICTQYPHQLSGGMRQRVIIAMALAAKPKVLIADEATTALDVTIQAEILKLLSVLQKTLDLTILFITHDLAVASEIADTVIVMKSGEIIEQGSMKAILQNPQQAYTQELIAIKPKCILKNVNPENKMLLEVKNIEVRYPIKKGFFRRTVGFLKVAENINFDLRMGETLALVGESGSGKTTVAKSILSLIKVSAGEVFFEGQPIQHCNQIQMIVQDPFAAMNPRMRVGDIIKEGLLAQKIGNSEIERQARIDRVLEKVGLKPEYKMRYPHQLSGGQRQRVCIARSLVLEPKVLICDEPTSSLDVWHQAHMIDLLLELQAQYGLSYLLITHNIALVESMAHSVAVMLKGRIIEQGSKQMVLNNPQQAFTQQLLNAVPRMPNGSSVLNRAYL